MSGMRGFWARYDAWWKRNAYWVWATVAVLNVWAGGIQPGGWRWFFLVYATVAAFWAGWHWREHVAIRRLERLDGQTGRDLIIATAQRYNRYGFAIEFVPMSDLLRKGGDGE